MKTQKFVLAMARPALILGILGAWCAPASAETILDLRFEAEVIGVYDRFGLFGPIAEGDAVLGGLRYGDPIPPGDGDDTFTSRLLPVSAGGVNQMSASVGGLTLRATEQIIAHSYNMEFEEDSIYGTDFQFNDADTSILSTALLPDGYRVSLGMFFGLFTTDPALSPFPDLPTSLLPLSTYDAIYTGGVVLARILDDQGRYVDHAIVEFRLTSLSAVPEPSTGLLAGFGLVAVGLWLRRGQWFRRRNRLSII